MVLLTQYIFIFDGKREDLHDDAELEYRQAESSDTEKILWKNIAEDIEYKYTQEDEDYPAGYIKTSDFEGDLILEDGELSFGPNILVKEGLKELFDGYEEEP